ncbi:MAG: hypothetical protein K6C36_05125 [Clostridia bacterium]|nr:hypothetical protein [Clostridia bacterium]
MVNEMLDDILAVESECRERVAEAKTAADELVRRAQAERDEKLLGLEKELSLERLRTLEEAGKEARELSDKLGAENEALCAALADDCSKKIGAVSSELADIILGGDK